MGTKKLDNFILRLFSYGVLIGLMFFICSGYSNFQSTIDREPPLINILENNLIYYDDEDINLLNYVNVSDNSNEYEVNILNEEIVNLPGTNHVQIEAIDSSGNSSQATIDVEVLSSTEWNEYVISLTNNYQRRRIENVDFENLKGRVDRDAFTLAEEFIGMSGACNEVAQAYINEYYGEEYNIFDTYLVTKEEALPGDIIYYVDGGLGEQHFAVYLGGASALQGNIYGTTVIGSVYMTYGSEPQFYRINGV